MGKQEGQEPDAAQAHGQELRPGEHASIQNQTDSELPLSLRMGDGGSLDLQLGPGQVLEVYAGESGARVVLRGGNAEDLLVVKPGSA